MSRKPKGEGLDLANKALAMTRTRVKFSMLYLSAKVLHLWQEIIFNQVGCQVGEGGLALFHMTLL